ncbi:uncharacterized protein LOC111639703 [Centruroides sculpturatus]|uniref:uncharacterized protein LOC111639703 n=1 Tax=Centruroides sculpturatus TaxID=218467 RepID=UPI000C6DFBD4|nr:uncharacterized protein LOC111639703 [Centruroides sculpturatus]
MAAVGLFGRIFRNSLYSCRNLMVSRYSSTKVDSDELSETNSQDLVVVEKFGKLYSIGLNRPEKRNCLNRETVKHLLDALKTFDEDNSAYAAVIYGKGGNFSAGYDLTEFVSSGINDSELKFSSMGLPRTLSKKPVVAAISGYAVAGGLELALMCDLRVMEETAIVGVYCRRFGIPLTDGGTVRLPKLIGLSRAMDMILTGRSVNAKEAFQWGLANYIVSCGTALGNAIKVANSLVKFPQKCLRTDMASAYYAAFDAKSMEDAFRYEFENGKDVIGEESIAGAQKFIEGVGRHGKFHLDENI